MDEFAKEKGIEENDLKELLAKGKEKLLAERAKRIRPQLDDKILLGWNALMITAYCKAYAATGNEEYRSVAIKAMSFVEDKFKNSNGSFFHTYKSGEAKIDAFLDDYAYLIEAYIHLQEIIGNQYYLENAKLLTEFVIDNFGTGENGYFYYTHKNQHDAIVRKKEVYDGATPSGNSVMVGNLVYLSIIFDNKEWNMMAMETIKSIAAVIIKYPTSFGVWASKIQGIAYGIKEVVLL